MVIEESDYIVESKSSNYEIRIYGPVLVAETKIETDFENASNQAFRILAGYIFGANKSKTKIAMAAPVTQSKGPSDFLVQFTMPKKYIFESLPIPNDSRVQLRQLPPRNIAVHCYSGSWSESRYNEKLTILKKQMLQNGLEMTGEPMFAKFNSPFQIWFFRRNEIWIEVKEKPTTSENK